MSRNAWIGFVIAFLLVAVGAADSLAAGGKTVGKNAGKIKGRWLRVEDSDLLKSFTSVYLGDLVTDIQWKEERNEAPIDEELLDEKLGEQFTMRLTESGALGSVLSEAPAEGTAGAARIDCDLTVEPGSRAARYVVGFGAGKSRSILECHIRDHASDADAAFFHAYGVGSGMGFKLVGGGARKMTQDDIQEYAKVLAELLNQVR